VELRLILPVVVVHHVLPVIVAVVLPVVVLPVVVVVHVVVLSIIVVHVAHVLHVWPWINVVGVAATNVSSAGWILSVHAGNKGNPEHFQVRCQVVCLLGDDTMKVTVLPFDAEHGRWTPHIWLQIRIIGKIVLLLLWPWLRLLLWPWLGLLLRPWLRLLSGGGRWPSHGCLLLRPLWPFLFGLLGTWVTLALLLTPVCRFGLRINWFLLVVVWRHGWKHYRLLRGCCLVIVALVTGRNVWLLLSYLWIRLRVGLTSLVVAWSSVPVAAVVTRVAAPVETAEGVADAIRVGLSHAPTVGLLAGTKLDGWQIVDTGT